MNTWQKKRKQAAQRPRRIIMNNDGDDVFLADNSSPDAFLKERSHGLEGSQVDAIFYSTTIGFSQHTHDSKVAELFDRTDDVLLPRNHAKALIAQGRDNLQLIIDFCRHNTIEAFWSLRMNDTHDNWFPFRYPIYKEQQPEHLLTPPDRMSHSVDDLSSHLKATAIDYAHAEVRNRQFEIIRDVCRRYDVDGIELDFMRDPIFFSPTLRGQAVGPECLTVMTDFMSRVRAMTEEVGKERGRPLLVACRGAATVAINRSIGIDLEAWLEKDLIDLLIPSLDLWPYTGPIRDTVELGRRHQVPVYASLDAVEPDSLEGWAGAATNAWSAGVDGIYTFNLFDPHLPHWFVLGDPDTLRNMDKVYAVDNLNYKKIRGFIQVVDPGTRLPLTLTPGQSQSVTLCVGDDLAARHTQNENACVLLTIEIDNLTHQDRIEFRLNDHPLSTEIVSTTEGVSPVACGTFLLKTRVAVALIRKGDNQFAAKLVTCGRTASAAPIITEIQLADRAIP